MALVNALLIVACGLMPLLLLFTIKILVDSSARQIAEHAFSWSQSALALCLVGLFFVASPILNSVYSLYRNRLSYSLQQRISELIHAKTTSIGYGYFEDQSYQNIFFRTTTESLAKTQAVFVGMMNVIQNALTIVALCCILFSIHWLVPVAVIIVGVPVFIVRLRHSRSVFGLRRAQTNEERKARYYNQTLVSGAFAKEMRIFGIDSYFKQHYRDTTEAIHAENQRIMRRRVGAEVVSQTLMSAAVIALFGLALYMAAKGLISVGALAMYVFAMYRTYSIAQHLFTNIAGLYESNLFLKNFYIFLALPEEQSGTLRFPSPIKKGISVRHLTFAYAGTEKPVLQDVSFDIAPGETVALLGNNGCGKSTLVKLLCGLYRPTSGTITIDGVDLNQINRTEVTRHIAAIFQDYRLFNDTLRQNIHFGNINRPENDVAIAQAADNAGLSSILSTLPQGLDTQLGTLLPESHPLSQGQRQRTALARAFFSDSQVVVLDEPMSSIDAFTAAELVDNFHQILNGRTAIIVSHRLATIRMADRIIYLKDSHIAESGTYDQLVSLRGEFYAMTQRLTEVK